MQFPAAIRTNCFALGIPIPLPGLVYWVQRLGLVLKLLRLGIQYGCCAWPHLVPLIGCCCVALPDTGKQASCGLACIRILCVSRNPSLLGSTHRLHSVAATNQSCNDGRQPQHYQSIKSIRWAHCWLMVMSLHCRCCHARWHFWRDPSQSLCMTSCFHACLHGAWHV